MAFEALIRNGRVVDGTGGPWFVADVALHRGLVAAVGRLDGARAALEIDATGKTVAPGFVDIHEHSDWTLLADPRASSAIRQGVTTVVPGNCGFSAAPLVDLSAQRGGLYGYVEGLTVDWRTFGEYLDRLRAARPAVNVAPLVGHGALRSAVMGFAPRPPQEGEQGAMRALLEEALEAGAFGLSAGLEYAPGQNAAPDELVDLLGPVRAGGRLFAVHIRSRDYHYLPAVEEALQVARRAGVATQLSHLTARFLGTYARDRGWLTLEDAVRRLTSFPARKLGLGDRGLLRPGMRADLVVFDAATLRPQDTALDPNRFPSGVSDVFVNGVPAVREGVATGARPGHVLRPT